MRPGEALRHVSMSRGEGHSGCGYSPLRAAMMTTLSQLPEGLGGLWCRRRGSYGCEYSSTGVVSARADEIMGVVMARAVVAASEALPSPGATRPGAQERQSDHVITKHSVPLSTTTEM